MLCTELFWTGWLPFPGRLAVGGRALGRARLLEGEHGPLAVVVEHAPRVGGQRNAAASRPSGSRTASAGTLAESPVTSQESRVTRCMAQVI